MAKQTEGRVLVGKTEQVNPGNNDALVLARSENGKGVGNLPGMNKPYKEMASENTDPMQKHESVAGIVGE